MKIVTRAILALCLALISFLPLIEAKSAQASYSFSFPITIQDTSNVSRTNVPVILSFGGTQLVNAGYITNGLDANMQNGSTNVPFMMDTVNVTTVIPSLPAGGSIPLNLLTGYSPTQTSFPIIVGNGGNITISDDPSLELGGGDFGLDTSGYVNVSALTSFNQASYIGGINDTGILYDVQWRAQTFTTPDYVTDIGTVKLYLKKVNNPLGNVTVHIRPTSLGLPTVGIATDITSSNVSTGTITGAYTVLSFTGLNAVLQPNTVYALVASAITATVTDYVWWEGNTSSGPYAGGQEATSADGDVTWSANPASDLNFEVDAYIPRNVIEKIGAVSLIETGSGGVVKASLGNNLANLTATGLTSNDTRLQILQSGATVSLLVNGVVKDSHAAVAIPNNGNSWAISQNMSMPYMTYYKEIVGATEVIRYQPNTMVVGTALPNLDSGGLYPGTINLGTNDHISIIYGQQTSNQQIQVSTNVTPGFTVPAFPMPQTWFAAGENLQKYGTGLAVGGGLASVVSGNATVNGLGTTWTSSLVGRVFQMNGTPYSVNISAVNSPTSLTLTNVYPFATAGPAAYTIMAENPPPFYDLFYEMATQAGIPVQTLYFVIVFAFSFIAALFAIMFTKSALLGVMVMTIMLFLASAATIVPMWIPFSILVIDFGIMYLYRQITY